MDEKKLLQALGFAPKEGFSDFLNKKYADGYEIKVDFGGRVIDFGGKIKVGEKFIQNITKSEDWVVLECVDRLLEKGYQPSDIFLEKIWPTGHGTSGRLDVLVCKGGRAFLMIECKVWGKEFEKAFKKTQKEGGQLFTYFQQDTHADFLMLYSSKHAGGEVKYQNEIIKIEDHYRTAGNVPDFFDRWSKITEQKGIFEPWVKPYDFETKALVKADLKKLTEEDSGFIFHEFLSILRKHSVSDKPNAFNKIFNLFLAKIYDEMKRDDDELDFQWLEQGDNPVEFQIRLINLYKIGMSKFLEKEVEGIDDDDFNYKTLEELKKKKKKWLKFNKIFDIKEVIDDESFDDNHKVLKEVVELLYKYQIRYPRKQRHLSDFFERLLTTGLKQEAGQYFTPPPITKFITKSLPVKERIIYALNKEVPELPAVIDYAVGSGHFITEMMEEYQNVLDSEIDISDFYPDAIEQLDVWRRRKYGWASKYIYGIEKDYRLVKVAKVGCYFYGDGLAQVIHGDGLDHFETSKSYRGLLKKNKEKPQFDFVISNPPYSVSTFRGDMKHSQPEKDFELYRYLSDRSSEIECLFIERTKQLLKTGGIAAVILPSSILSNTGIYTKTREILLKYFEFVAITELGSNTFMATGTNTVVLFLKRRKDDVWENIKTHVDTFFCHAKDVTVNGVERVFSKYVAEVWKGVSFEDYVSLIEGRPNEKIRAHELYKEYRKKIKAKNEAEQLNKLCQVEAEKLLYFILAYPQRVVLVKTGEKNTEKAFLGYEFSNRRGHEGIHPIQRGKTIDECTQLFDPEVTDNPAKASTYILDVFNGKTDREVDISLKNHVLRANLADMMTWDRVEFEKNVNLSVKKKIKIESRWEVVRLDSVVSFKSGLWKSEKSPIKNVKVLRNTNFKLNNGKLDYSDVATIDVEEKQLIERKLEFGDILLEKSGGSDTQAIGRVVIFEKDDKDVYSYSNFCSRLRVLDKKIINSIYLGLYLHHFYKKGGTESLQNGIRLLNIDMEGYKGIKIPLPPLEVQEKIVKEMGVLEEEEKKAKEYSSKLKGSISNLVWTKNNFQMLKNALNTINPSKEVIKSLKDETEVSFLGMEDVDNEAIIRNLQTRRLEEVKKGYTFFQEDDVLLAKITPCMENGKGALVGKIKNNLGFGSTEFFVLRPDKQKILPKILYYFTKMEDFRKEAEKNMTGASGHRRVPQSFIENYKIPLPTLAEQQKIVTEIEKIESQIEALEKELADIPAQREAVLKKYL